MVATVGVGFHSIITVFIELLGVVLDVNHAVFFTNSGSPSYHCLWSHS